MNKLEVTLHYSRKKEDSYLRFIKAYDGVTTEYRLRIGDRFTYFNTNYEIIKINPKSFKLLDENWNAQITYNLHDLRKFDEPTLFNSLFSETETSDKPKEPNLEIEEEKLDGFVLTQGVSIEIEDGFQTVVTVLDPKIESKVIILPTGERQMMYYLAPQYVFNQNGGNSWTENTFDNKKYLKGFDYKIFQDALVLYESIQDKIIYDPITFKPIKKEVSNKMKDGFAVLKQGTEVVVCNGKIFKVNSVIIIRSCLSGSEHINRVYAIYNGEVIIKTPNGFDLKLDLNEFKFFITETDSIKIEFNGIGTNPAGIGRYYSYGNSDSVIVGDNNDIIAESPSVIIPFPEVDDVISDSEVEFEDIIPFPEV